MSRLKEILKEIAKTVGCVGDCVKVANDLKVAFSETLEQLTRAEAQIESELKSTLEGLIRNCRNSSNTFSSFCKVFLDKWENSKYLIEKKKYNASDLTWIRSLQSAAVDIGKEYSILTELLEKTLDTATSLTEDCKQGINKARESKSNAIVLNAAAAAIVAVISGCVVAPLVAAGAGAGVAVVATGIFGYKAYDRIGRLKELIDSMKSHLGQLNDKIDTLNRNADAMAALNTGVNIMIQLLKEVEVEEIQPKLKEQEEIEARAKNVFYPTQ